MPTLFHYLHLRAYAQETEDPEKVRQALRTVVGDEGLDIAEVVNQGTHGNRILLFEARITGGRAQRSLFEALARDDPEAPGRLADEAERRVDEQSSFHFRLDKQEACEGRVRLLAAGDDAIAVRGKFRVYPGSPGSGGPSEVAQQIRDHLLRRRP